MTSDLELRVREARAKHGRLAEMEQAREQLSELEEEARLERARAAASAEAEGLGARLEARLEAFRADKGESDREVRALLEQARAVVARRRSLAREARGLFRDCERWAALTIRVERPGEVLSRFDRSEVRARAEQWLMDAGVVNARLMALDAPQDDVGAVLADAVARLT